MPHDPYAADPYGDEKSKKKKKKDKKKKEKKEKVNFHIHIFVVIFVFCLSKKYFLLSGKRGSAISVQKSFP